ncbi:MAG: glycosyltransferase family 4 protein [Candidatus Moraniibacteriota bacterium]
MPQPKILMFGWEFPPIYSGGLGIACRGLTRALTDIGADVTFVVPSHIVGAQSDWMQILRADESFFQSSIDFKVFPSLLTPYVTETSYLSQWLRSPEQRVYGQTLADEVLRYASYAGDIARHTEFDVIHAHDWLTYLAGLEAKRVSGKPLVVHVHSTEFDRTGGNGANEFVSAIERQGLQEADAVIAISEYTKNIIIQQYDINPDKIVVVHNGIEEQPHQSGGESDVLETLRQYKAQGKLLVLSLGRLTLQKGIDYFLRMAKRVSEYVPNAIFLVVGSGDMEHKLISQAAELGIADKVIFTGFFRGKQIEDAYKMADLFVVPSVSEPFGLTVLESMQHGTPVIVSKQSGVSEIAFNALKVDFWDTEEMANKAIAILKYGTLHGQLSDMSREETKHHSWERAAHKCLALFRKLTHL